MMTQQLGFSILSAPLAAIDRRSLSHAWLSLLGDRGTRGSAGQTAHAAPANGRAPAPLRAGERSADGYAEVHQSIVAAVDRRERPRDGTEITADRRMQRSRLAREIERAFLRPAPEPKRSSFTLENGTRVHVQLRGSGERLHLVAVCAPAARATVAEALAQARYALARRGIVIDAQVR